MNVQAHSRVIVLSTAPKDDLLKYIRQQWIKCSLGKLESNSAPVKKSAAAQLAQAPTSSSLSVISTVSTVPTTAVKQKSPIEITQSDLESLFNIEVDCTKDKALEALKRTAAQLKELKITKTKLEPSTYQDLVEFNVAKPESLKQIAKKQDEAQEEAALNKAKLSDAQKSKLKEEKLFAMRLLNKYSQKFFQRLNANTTIAEKLKIIKDLSFEWLFEPQCLYLYIICIQYFLIDE